MIISDISLTNVKGFKSLPWTKLSQSINVFIGSNNAGKSTILDSIYTLQRPKFTARDITKGEQEGKICLFYVGSHLEYFTECNLDEFIEIDLQTSRISLASSTSRVPVKIFKTIPAIEPFNLFYPFLSKRKVTVFNRIVQENTILAVNNDLANLYSKIERLSNSEHDCNEEFVNACENILGFKVTSWTSGDGKDGVYVINNDIQITLLEMGEGVINILGLLVDLCIAKEKIFIIEELENDLHPKALKALLAIIIKKSDSNQFFISTHSNLVMRNLGGVTNSKVFKVSNNSKDSTYPKLFLAQMEEIPENSESRRIVLEELGYEFVDFDLWKAWLFLEESSAELIIRDYLIKWFAKSLIGKLRTFSSGGFDVIADKFEDFNRLFVFLHLEPTYKNKVWVQIDAGVEEEKVIDAFRKKYSEKGWNESNFHQFGKHDFEEYYPPVFKEEVERVLAIENRKTKRNEKKILLDKVLLWIDENPILAEKEFSESAKEVITFLKKLEIEINS